MKKRMNVIRKALSLLLSLTMVLSGLNFSVKAEEYIPETYWESVELKDITSSDVIAITMTTSDGVTLALSNANGTGAAPKALVGKVEENKLSLSGASSEYGWKITAVQDGYKITTVDDAKNLYATNTNNGVRVGSSEAIWNLTDGYLSLNISETITRYLGVYNKADWRTYTSTTTNIANETLRFFKYVGQEEVDDSDITKLTPSATYTGEKLVPGATIQLQCGTLTNVSYEVSINGSEYKTIEGNEYVIPVANAGNNTLNVRASDGNNESQVLSLTFVGEKTAYSFAAEKTNELKDGMYIYIVHPTSQKVLSSVVSGKKLAGVDGTIDGALTITDGMQVLKVSVNEDGHYTFTTPQGTYLTSGSTGNAVSFTEESNEYSLWDVEEKTVGEQTGLLITNVNASFTKNEVTYKQALEYYSGFTTYNLTDNVTNAYLFDAYQLNYEPVVKARSQTSATTTQGIVTYINGKNVYIEDATAGIDVYFTTAPSDLAIGDVIKVTGTPTTYNGLVELTNPTYIILGTSTLPLTTTTIEALNKDYAGDNHLESKRVHLENVILGTIDTAANTTISDEEGNTIALYKAAALNELKADDGSAIQTGDIISLTAIVSDYKGYQLLVPSIDDLTFVERKSTDIGGGDIEEPSTGLSEVIEEGKYVIWNPNYTVTLANLTNGSGYYIGETVKGTTIDEVSGYSNTSVWEIKAVEGGYTFEQNGLYMGTTSSNKLTVEAAPANKVWKVTVTEDGQYYNLSCNGRYLEWYANYSDWSMYTSINDPKLFQMWITPATVTYETDSNINSVIAQFGGGGPYAEAQTTIHGDAYVIGDQKASSDSYVAYVSGKEVVGFTTGTSSTTGITNYYMGGTGLGSGTNDYMEFVTSSAGYGDMLLSFRLRASNSGSGEWQVQYSKDGTNFTNFTTGSYSCGYTNYNSDGTTTPVNLTGAISDGIAKTSIKSATYISFTFDVPRDADNAKQLYIRLVPSTTVRANGTASAPSSSGTIRIDTVQLVGSPIVDDSIVGYVSVTPDGVDEDQVPGTPLQMTTPTKDATIQYRFVTSETEGEWTVLDSEHQPTLPEKLPVVLQVKAVKEGLQDSIVRTLTYAAGTVASVKVTPNGGGVYIANEGENVTVTLSCDTEGATIYVSLDDGETYNEYSEDAPITIAKGFKALTIKAYATKDGFKDSAVTTRKFVERSQETYNIYFGQMHSHTSYSDGAGSANDAFDHADDVANLDFLAVTDHSNSFDNAGSGVLGEDASAISEEWKEGKELAQQYTTKDFVGLFGFEMTWSNGLGHINTFNTPGFQSRTQAAYGTYSTALQNYYDTLKTVSDSISQFNHPGTTFGDFSDFAYYDEEIDQLITLIEVGNGEGTIGSSSYFPSYEYYTRALDKGWHVAPTNNQDNHKGLWGDANTARSVVLCDTLDEESIYDAMRNYRVYATEDNDLGIYYTLNDNIMGTVLSKDDVDDTLTLKVQLVDPTDNKIGKVEVIVNGGLSIASKEVTTNEDTITFNVGANYSYYYIKVTEQDGDIAVTAPVWVGSVEAVGISTFTTDAPLAVQNESLDLNLEAYNNETTPLEINKIEFSVLDANDETKVIHTLEGSALEEANIAKVGKLSTASYKFNYAHDGLGSTTYIATVYGMLNGVEKVYSEKLELNYVSKDMVTTVVVDGTHYNDYVTGYYGGNMTNFTQLAADEAVKVVIAGGDKPAANRSLTKDEWQALLADSSLLIVSAPARNSGTANAGDYTASEFEDWYIDLVANFVKEGGSLIVCGLADYQDTKASDASHHSSAQLNKLLAATGSTMTINDDEAYDTVHNGGQAYRLYPENFDLESPWLQGIVTAASSPDNYQKYSQYSGATVNPGNGHPLVSGFDTTYSVDSDKDKVGNSGESDGTYNKVVNEGNAHFLAVESMENGGNVFVAGGVFVSDFEVAYELDNAFDLPYANTTIAKNILKVIKVELPVTSIQDVREAANNGDFGSVYRIQGNVTVARNIEQNAFFDCIYVQDETAGIDIFPFADDSIKLGAKVDITGYIDSYQGDLELKVMSYTIIDNENVEVVEPTLLPCKDASNYKDFGGLLTKVEGTVKEGSIYYNADGTLAQFVVVDETGETTIFIDGYILSATTNQNTLANDIVANAKVSAVGVQYMHPEVFIEGVSDNVSVLRVRNCDEIVVEKESKTTVTDIFNDVNEGEWYVDSIQYVYDHGIMTGYENGSFGPIDNLTRAQAMQILYNMAGKPEVTNYTATEKFNDVNTWDWYQDAINWAYNEGITTGYTGIPMVGACDDITREQFVVLVYRYAKMLGLDVSKSADLSKEYNANKISDYATEAMSWAIATGMLSGIPTEVDGVEILDLAPDAATTRAQVARMMMGFLETYQI